MDNYVNVNQINRQNVDSLQPLEWQTIFINNKFYLCDKNTSDQLTRLERQIQYQKANIINNIDKNDNSQYGQEKILSKKNGFKLKIQEQASNQNPQKQSLDQDDIKMSQFQHEYEQQKNKRLLNNLYQEELNRTKLKQIKRRKRHEQQVKFRQFSIKKKSNVKLNVTQIQIKQGLSKKFILEKAQAQTKQSKNKNVIMYPSKIVVVQQNQKHKNFESKAETRTKIQSQDNNKDKDKDKNKDIQIQQLQQKQQYKYKQFDIDVQTKSARDNAYNTKYEAVYFLKQCMNSLSVPLQVVYNSYKQQNQMIQNKQQTIQAHLTNPQTSLPIQNHVITNVRRQQKLDLNSHLVQYRVDLPSQIKQKNKNKDNQNLQGSDKNSMNLQKSIEKNNINKIQVQQIQGLYLQKKNMEDQINNLKRTLREHQIQKLNLKINQKLSFQPKTQQIKKQYQKSNFIDDQNNQKIVPSDETLNQNQIFARSNAKNQNNKQLSQQVVSDIIYKVGVGKIFKNSRKSIDLRSQIQKRNISSNNSEQLCGSSGRQKIKPKFQKQKYLKQSKIASQANQQFKECHFNQHMDLISCQNQQTEYMYKKESTQFNQENSTVNHNQIHNNNHNNNQNNNQNYNNRQFSTFQHQRQRQHQQAQKGLNQKQIKSKEVATIDIDSQIKYKKPQFRTNKKNKGLEVFDNTIQSIPVQKYYDDYQNNINLNSNGEKTCINNHNVPQFIRSTQFENKNKNRLSSMDSNNIKSKSINANNTIRVRDIKSMIPNVQQNQLLFSKFMQLQKRSNNRNQFVYNQVTSEPNNNPEFAKSAINRQRNIESSNSVNRQGRSLNLRGIIVKNKTKSIINQEQEVNQQFYRHNLNQLQNNSISPNFQSSSHSNYKLFQGSKISKFYKSRKFQTIQTPSQGNTHIGPIYRLKIQSSSPKNQKTLYELEFEKKKVNRQSDSQQSQDQQLKIPKFQFTYKQIPQLPKPPYKGINQQEFVKITDKLCKIFGISFKKNKISSMIMKKFKNCLIYNLPQTNKKVIWHYYGKLYIGQGEQDGSKSGQGIEFIPDKHLYRGQFLNNKKHGSGAIVSFNGDIYQGQWIQNQKNGHGKFYSKISNQYYEGEFKNGKLQGFGTLKVTNKHIYQGTFFKSLRHGYGRQIFQNGDSYKGQYQRDKFNGKGKYKWHNENYYSGNFSNGYRNGKGTWKSCKKNGDVYKGDYFQDKKQGQGRYIWSDGTIFEGHFNQDKKDGEGKVIYTDGKQVKGVWKLDKVEQILSQSYQQGGDKPLDKVQKRQVNRTTKIKLIEQVQEI